MANVTDLDLELEGRRRVLGAWVATRRRIAALEAEAAELLVEQIAIHDADVAVSPFHREAIYRSMVAEFSAAGHVSKGSVEFAFADAQALHTHLPGVRAAFASGAISVGHVREIARASALVAEAIRNQKVDPSVMELFETAVLIVAEQDTAARTKAHARQVAAALVGETLVDRHRRATEERCVTVKSLDDGLALLTAVLPEWIATAISDRLSRMTSEVVRARSAREIVPLPWWFEADGDGLHPEDFSLDDPSFDLFDDGVIHGADSRTFATDPEIEQFPPDSRTWAQTEADLFTDLLLTADPSAANGDGLEGIQARVQVTVAATTLAGVDDRAAELDVTARCILTSPAISRGATPAGLACSLIPAGWWSRPTLTPRPRACADSFVHAISAAGSRGVVCQRTAARSTTTTITRRAEGRDSTTSATSVGTTTPSSTRTSPTCIGGLLNKRGTGASPGTARSGAITPTRHPDA